MSTLRASLALSILLVAPPITASFAQSTACLDQIAAGIPCCGQYECADESLWAPPSRDAARHKVQAANTRTASIVEKARTAQLAHDEPTFPGGDRHHD